MAGFVLILDDDELVGVFVRRLAEQMGFEAKSVTTPDAFLAALAERAPDEIVLDLQLGEQDGVAVLRLLAARACAARITLLSGFDSRALASARELAAELNLNVGDALSKPVRAAALRAALAPTQAAGPAPLPADAVGAAIAARELFLQYQPIVDCATGEVRSLEALVRWRRADGERVPPDRFIPTAEADPELMDRLTMEVARLTGEDARAMAASGFALPVAINISAQNLRRLDFPERLSAVFEGAGAQAPRIKLEVTETAAMTQPMVTLDVLLRLRLMGFSLAVDDFGTGYTSIAMLRRLPYSELKIDRSFVAPMLGSPDAHAVVAAALALARSMGLTTVAEGVESAEAMQALRDLGASSAQGYAISKPLDLAVLLPWLAERRRRESCGHASLGANA